MKAAEAEEDNGRKMLGMHWSRRLVMGEISTRFSRLFLDNPSTQQHSQINRDIINFDETYTKGALTTTALSTQNYAEMKPIRLCR